MQVVYTKQLISSTPGTDETRHMPIYRKLKLVDIILTPNVTTAVDGTNYMILTVLNGSTTLAVRNNQSTALTAGTAERLSLVSSVDLDFDDLESLKITKTHAGTGDTCNVEFAFVFDLRRA